MTKEMYDIMQALLDGFHTGGPSLRQYFGLLLMVLVSENIPIQSKLGPTYGISLKPCLPNTTFGSE